MRKRKKATSPQEAAFLFGRFGTRVKEIGGEYEEYGNKVL